MDKKALLIKLLTQLENDWFPAGGLKILAEQGDLDGKMIDSIISTIQTAIDGVEDQHTAKKLEESVDILKKIHQQEADDNTAEQKDLEELENMIETL